MGSTFIKNIGKGKEWSQHGMDRVYIQSEVLNKIEAECNLRKSGYSDKSNKFFFDAALNAIMRSYKGKKPQVEIQF